MNCFFSTCKYPLFAFPKQHQILDSDLFSSLSHLEQNIVLTTFLSLSSSPLLLKMHSLPQIHPFVKRLDMTAESEG